MMERQENSKGGSTVLFADYINKTIMLADYPVDGRQTKAGALTWFFGGVKRVEDSADLFLCHAAPIVLH